MKYIFAGIIWVYKIILKPVFIGLGLRDQKTCKFNPSCSEYCLQAFLKYGSIKGFVLCSKRLGRCHPWNNEMGEDPLV